MAERRMTWLLLIAMAAARGSVLAAEKPGAAAPVPRLTRILVGTYRGTSPGNELVVVSSRIVAEPTSQLQHLDVRVTGTYEGDAVDLRGLWRISYSGESVWLVFIPGGDPVEGSRRYGGSAFSPTELDAGCWAPLVLRGGAFEGRIRPFPNCRKAIAANAVQSVEEEWSVHFGEDGIRFHDDRTDETLAFSRAQQR